MTQSIDTTTTSELSWLLDNLVAQVPETLHAIVLSEDGLPMACSKYLGRTDAEHLSAMASGLQSLARGVGKHFKGGQVRQTVIEMDDLYLFVTTAGDGARLAVIASGQVDAGVVVYEMTMLVKQVGRYLSAAPRSDVPTGNRGEDA